MMKTLNGYSINELPTLLDQPLPPQAYKQIPGGAGLTDIDAGWQRRAFNKIFGLYGLGWGFCLRLALCCYSLRMVFLPYKIPCNNDNDA